MYKETIAVYRRRIKSAVRNIATLKSRVEKRPSRFSLIGDAHKIPRGELRANALVVSCAGNFALRARCKLRGERPSTHGRDAAQAAYAMRAHWSVENNLHWVLDTIFNEDYCLVRKDNAAANLNVLRKIALNTLKQVDFSDVVKAKQLPLCHKQRLCDKREDCLERIFTAL